VIKFYVLRFQGGLIVLVVNSVCQYGTGRCPVTAAMSRVAPSNNRRTSGAPGSVEQSSKVSDISAFTRASMSKKGPVEKGPTARKCSAGWGGVRGWLLLLVGSSKPNQIYAEVQMPHGLLFECPRAAYNREQRAGPSSSSTCSVFCIHDFTTHTTQSKK
jgi:hypothetical protein